MVRRVLVIFVLMVGVALGACTNPSGGGGSSAAPAASGDPTTVEPGY